MIEREGKQKMTWQKCKFGRCKKCHTNCATDREGYCKKCWIVYKMPIGGWQFSLQRE
jgi:hypothetical protein